MSLLQQPHNRVRAAHSAHLLVVPERDQQRAFRAKIGARNQHLQGGIQERASIFEENNAKHTWR